MRPGKRADLRAVFIRAAGTNGHVSAIPIRLRADTGRDGAALLRKEIARIIDDVNERKRVVRGQIVIHVDDALVVINRCNRRAFEIIRPRDIRQRQIFIDVILNRGIYQARRSQVVERDIRLVDRIDELRPVRIRAISPAIIRSTKLAEIAGALVLIQHRNRGRRLALTPSRALIRQKEKCLVFFDRSAGSGAKHIALK